MTTPLHHPAELMRLIVQRLAEEMRLREQVRVASFRSRSSYVAPSLTSELRGKRNGSET